MKVFFFLFFACIIITSGRAAPIDRKALVERHHPHITTIDTMASLSVGNGKFAVTVDITGLQTFPEIYSRGIPLGTQSEWGWHSFPNPKEFRHEETLKDYDFGRGRKEPYSVQFEEKGRHQEAADWFRENPHRLHLGTVGFEFPQSDIQKITDVDQELDLWNGIIKSQYKLNNVPYQVETVCNPEADMLAAYITSPARSGVCFRFAYPTGGHSDDACDWKSDEKHSTTLLHREPNLAVLRRELDEAVYFVTIRWEGEADLVEKQKNYFVLYPKTDNLSFTCAYTLDKPSGVSDSFSESSAKSADYWNAFWQEGAAVDFSLCTDSRASELERRVVLSQYLLSIQCAGNTPPQETGLTYNSWFGKFHLEMIWWHQAQFALWNRTKYLERTLQWYLTVVEEAREIASRQGFEGIRWMKMTDPHGGEAPSSIGSFLIWQQPHIIYLAELVYRANNNPDILFKYNDLIQSTAEFMYSFACYDKERDRYVLKGVIPAQETLEPEDTMNPPFELSYWIYGMETAQKWRERNGMERNPKWDELISKISPLAYKDGLYLAAETAPDTYTDVRYTSDHMAVLGAVGILPMNKLIRADYMNNTLNWVWNNWNWDRTWGWDYPMTAMTAARMGQAEKAVSALLMDKRTNTYLPNGHNYQDEHRRCYLPGNGGLLTAVAMMCAGWDGVDKKNPGFPENGKWDVRWENLKPLP